MTIYGDIRRLAFARIGDKVWIEVSRTRCPFVDIFYFKVNFYAVDSLGVTFIFYTDDDKNPKATAIAPAPPGTEFLQWKYLVELEGQLLLVIHIYGGRLFPAGGNIDDDEEDGIHDAESGTEGGNSEGEQSEQDSEPEYVNRNDISYSTIGFTVMKLVEDTERRSRSKYRWKKVNNSGEDEALFVGLNSSVSVSASNFPGCEANCIYFTGDLFMGFDVGGHDMGIFSMEDASIKYHYTGQSFSCLCPPLWYM